MLVHYKVTPSIKFASTHLYNWVERGTVRVKCLAKELQSRVECMNYAATAIFVYKCTFFIHCIHVEKSISWSLHIGLTACPLYYSLGTLNLLIPEFSIFCAMQQLLHRALYIVNYSYCICLRKGHSHY